MKRKSARLRVRTAIRAIVKETTSHFWLTELLRPRMRLLVPFVLTNRASKSVRVLASIKSKREAVKDRSGL
jgi:hypothetical protein